MKMMWGSMCFCAVLLVLGCEDQLGNQQSDDNTTSTSSGAENGADGHNSSSAPTEQNQSANSTTTANASTPSTHRDDPREQPGQWADEELFTIVSPDYDPSAHQTSMVSFCDLVVRAESLVILRVRSKLEQIPRCEGDSDPLNANTYTIYDVDNLANLSGKTMPNKFKLRRFLHTLETEKTYIIGLMEIDGIIYSGTYAYEIMLYDPEKESPRIKFSGKRESLIAAGDAAFSNQSDCRETYTKEQFEQFFFDVNETRCN